ncbi:MAG: DUF4249 family protein [Odoribacteraceae bacterium]|jgi:hypothetical protein|nr:DUF4249 family protein [Odoribacteraceae bacterium]
MMKFIPLILLLTACTERIDIRTGEATRQLFAYGYVTSDTTRHVVTISRATAYFATTPRAGISGAQVVIVTDSATYALAEVGEEAGVYCTDADVAGVPGEAYELVMMLDFDGDGAPEEYRASACMPLTSRIDSVALRHSTVFKNQVEVIGYGTLPDNEKNFMSFHLYRNGEHLTRSLEDFFVMDDTHFTSREMNGVLCQLLDQEEEESRLVAGDTVTLRVDVLSEEYARFIREAQQELRAANPIFGGPPANVFTNIRCTGGDGGARVSGFFAAFPTDSKSVIYR